MRQKKRPREARQRAQLVQHLSGSAALAASPARCCTHSFYFSDNEYRAERSEHGAEFSEKSTGAYVIPVQSLMSEPSPLKSFFYWLPASVHFTKNSLTIPAWL